MKKHFLTVHIIFIISLFSCMTSPNKKNFSLFSPDNYRGKEHYEYDKNGNIVLKKIEIKDSYDYELYFEYDDKNNLLKVFEDGKLKEFYEYDEKGNLTYKRTYTKSLESNEETFLEEWREYDSMAHLTHLKQSNGYEERYKYDSSGNEIYMENSKNEIKISEYDSAGNCIHKKWINNNQGEWFDDYNDDGKLIYSKYIFKDTTEEVFYEYDKNDNLILIKSPNGKHSFKYDSKKNLIFEKKEKWYKKWYKYDSNNNLIFEKIIPSKQKIWYKYDTNGNLSYVRDSNRHEAFYDERGNLLCDITQNVDTTVGNLYEYDFWENKKIKTIVKQTYCLEKDK